MWLRDCGRWAGFLLTVICSWIFATSSWQTASDVYVNKSTVKVHHFLYYSKYFFLSCICDIKDIDTSDGGTIIKTSIIWCLQSYPVHLYQELPCLENCCRDAKTYPCLLKLWYLSGWKSHISITAIEKPYCFTWYSKKIFIFITYDSPSACSNEKA